MRNAKCYNPDRAEDFIELYKNTYGFDVSFDELKKLATEVFVDGKSIIDVDCPKCLFFLTVRSWFDNDRTNSYIGFSSGGVLHLLYVMDQRDATLP